MGSVLVFILVCINVFSSFAVILTRKRTGCFAFIVFWMSCYCKCHVALPHGPMGWCAVCDFGISSLPFTIVYISCPLGSPLLLWNFESIRGSLMRHKKTKLARLAQKTCTLYTVSSFMYYLRPLYEK